MPGTCQHQHLTPEVSMDAQRFILWQLRYAQDFAASDVQAVYALLIDLYEREDVDAEEWDDAALLAADTLEDWDAKVRAAENFPTVRQAMEQWYLADGAMNLVRLEGDCRASTRLAGSIARGIGGQNRSECWRILSLMRERGRAFA